MNQNKVVNNHFPFIIVGGGISGLQAAANLADLGQSFTLFQAGNRLGGRIHSVTVGQAMREDEVECGYDWFKRVEDVPVELGATWICEDNTSMLQLCKKYKIDLHEQYYQGKHIFALSQEKKYKLEDYSQFYKKHQDKLVPLVLHIWQLKHRYWHLIELKQKGILRKDQDIELKDIYLKYDNISGYDFILGVLKDVELANLMDNQVVTLQCISSKDFSALQFILDDTGLDNVFYYLGLRNDNIDGFRAKNGLKQLISAMKQGTLDILKEKGLNHKEEQVFRLNTPIAEIRNHVYPVEVITQKGQIFTCDQVLLAVPSATMSKIKIHRLSEGKRILMDNQLDAWYIRMVMVFPRPFWRKDNNSGNVNFSHNFPMNQLVDLSPHDQSCGILAFVFVKEGYLKWRKAIEFENSLEDEQERKVRMYELNKTKCLQIIADLYLKGDTKHPSIQQCAIFTRSLSENPFIRSTFDATLAPYIFQQLYFKNLDHLEPQTSDQHNIIMLGSDFALQEDRPGYMQGAVRVANRKINKCLRPKL